MLTFEEWRHTYADAFETDDAARAAWTAASNKGYSAGVQDARELLAAHNAGAQGANVHTCALCGSTGDCKAKDPRLLNDCQGAWYRPAAQPQPIPQTDAARDVLAERARQVSVEGWTPEHDDAHDDGEMALAAACYAESSVGYYFPGTRPETWPWSMKWWKPTTPRRDLVKAAALILAEIERLDRAKGE